MARGSARGSAKASARGIARGSSGGALPMTSPVALASPYLVTLPLSSGTDGAATNTWTDEISGRDLSAGGSNQPLLRIESGIRVLEFSSNRRMRYIPGSSFSAGAFSVHALIKPTLPVSLYPVLSFGADYSGNFFATGWTQDNWIINGLLDQGKPLNPMGQNRWFLVSSIFDGSTCRFFCDGAEISATSTNTVAGQTALAASQTVAELGVGYWSPGGTAFNGRIGFFGFYEAAHSVDDVRALRNYLRDQYSDIYSPPSDIVVWVANSLGTSTFTTTNSSQHMSVLAATGGTKTYSFVNASIGGITTPQMTGRVTEHYSKYLAQATGRKVAVVWEATNDFAVNAATAATAYTNLVTLKNSLKAAGFDKVVLAKVIDRNAGGFQSFLNDLATLIDDNSSDWDAIVTPPVELTEADASANTTYFIDDRVHLKAAGNALMAPLFRTAIESVLP